MTLNPQLLSILVCPETKQPVLLADDSTLVQLNDLAAKGVLKTVRGKAVRGQLGAVLVRQDRKIGYRIDDDIPIMLVDEGLDLSPLR